SVRRDSRGRGFGSRILAAWMRGKKKVLNEVAKPSGRKDALKRIRFYKRMDFKLNRYDYVQPPYGRGKKAVPLYIMSYPQKLGRKEFLKARRIIHRIVYGVETPFAG
ncbi:MAG: GNAT family N-acetyltransferase, partial [Candidatus Micrarchaeota archaeon]|nr:GNAT family N-acetyltransferase [Candidatus Micrarchaeota archaeon]